MNIELIILLLSSITIIIALFICIPKNKIRHALLTFHVMQVITWLLGLIVVEMRLIKYPIRMFSYAGKTSFLFEFFAYPAICAIFNVHFPSERNKRSQLSYYALYPTTITIFEKILEVHTNLITYIHWEWYWSWITLLITLFLSRLYYLWFFSKVSIKQNET